MLLDDIASLLDDIALLTKVAAKKTTGVIGDDLALNAQQVSGVDADRELPVVWAVAKGSALNKAILVPVALGLSAFAPRLISPLLMLGGAYLCYEGSEKVLHRLLHGKEAGKKPERAKPRKKLSKKELLLVEKDKIRGAIRTDFVLSAEIIVISLGTVAGAALPKQLAALALISAIMTAGVYGLVGVIIKIDDLGAWLLRRGGSLNRLAGRLLLRSMPLLMKALTVAGTAAMFLVGGGIINHGLHPVRAWVEHASAAAGTAALPLSLGLELSLGFLYGLVLVGAAALAARIYRPFARRAA